MDGTQYTQLSQADREAILGIGKGFKEEYEKGFTEFKGQVTGFNSEAKEKIDKLTVSMADIQAKYDESAKKRGEFEKQLADGLAALEGPKSIGEQVITNEELIKFGKSGLRGGMVIGTKRPGRAWGAKDITNLSTVMPVPIQAIGLTGRLPFGVRTLCPTGRTSAGAVEYFRETSFTNAADVVPEGTKKPQSDKVFTPITAVIRTIATYFKVSQQSWDDLPFLSSQIEANGIYGVQLKEDQQLLNGTGVTPQMEGFNHVAGAAPANVTGDNLVDAIGRAFFDLASKGYLPDGSVVNPTDWGAVAMMKNAQGNYLFANPLDYSGISRVWGTRLVMSSNQAASTFLVGAFGGNCQIIDRDDVNVQISNQNEDDFVKNMYTVLVEERMVLVITQPLAFEKGTVPVVTP